MTLRRARGRHVLAGALVCAALVARAPAVLAQPCLNADAQRDAIRSGHVVPLGTVLDSVRQARLGEVVRVRLCESPSGHVYMLTVLRRDGKVAVLHYDAATGAALPAK